MLRTFACIVRVEFATLVVNTASPGRVGLAAFS